MSLYPGTVIDSLDVEGTEVRFHDSMTKDASHTIVMIHGTGGTTGTHFFSLFPMLATRHRVIGVDLASGTGAAEPTIARLAAQVSTVIEERISGPVSLAAYSLGVPIALEVATRLPERVQSLALLNGWVKTDREIRLRLNLWRELFENSDVPTLAKFMILNTYSRAYLNARSWSELETLFANYVVGPGSDGMMRLNASLDATHLPPRVLQPALVIGSEKDQLIPVEHSMKLAAELPGGLFTSIGGGHASVTERPAELFYLIDRFVRDPRQQFAHTDTDADVIRQLARI